MTAIHPVAACLITNDDYNPDEIKRLLASLDGVADHIFVSYNGQRGKLPWYKWTDIPVTYETTQWTDDFAAARNHSFSLVPRDEFEWYMWLDTDDIFVVDGDLDEMFESLDEMSRGIFLRYDYAIDPETGAVVVEQWRERFLSTKYEWTWRYPIHEVCIGAPNTQFAKRDDAHIEHLRKSGEERGARDRNRRIISKALRENPNEPRYLYYFAAETLALADSMEPGAERNEVIDASIQAFRKFIQSVHEVTDDVYMANTRIADLYRMKGDHNKAIDVDLQSIKFYPTWPDGFLGAAKSLMELKDWMRMEGFADLAIQAKKPTTTTSIESMNSSFTPYMLRGIARGEQGNLEGALEDLEKAREFWNPPGGDLDDRIEAIKKRLEGGVEDGTDLRLSLRNTRKEKSIAFYTNPLVEPWHPELEKISGAGGAETCIMRLAPRFAADGWRVAVYGTPGPYRGVHEGVEYWDSDEFSNEEEFSALITSRAPIMDPNPIGAKKIFLWMHDVNVGHALNETYANHDGIIALTHWHARHLNRLYGIPMENLLVIPNGIELDLFPREVALADRSAGHDPRFIYSSSPDRGLENLLHLWPSIRELFPGATLDIFYGWNIIDKLITGPNANPYLKMFKENIMYMIQALEPHGVTAHGRVPQSELAQHMLNVDVWAYPTDFMETFCITALEMQAAGVIPIVSELAGLTETVPNPRVRVDGWPKNVTYQRQFLDTLEATLSGEEVFGKQKYEGRLFAEQFSWDNVYDIWLSTLASAGVGAAEREVVA
jgi:glycosyltransferase involved in cell wall biosynthesis/tetratricopeptide (TPR) repeat protein